MKIFRPLRLLLLALVVSLVPASSFAGVFISVNFAPPILPVYEQPPCPEPDWMWIPGYWAYGEDGYYWVPGTWVPAPYDGALWTPPYWGWENNFYIFHPGYWGRHVGYYGGVNYGFGYMGVGFVGGMWRGHDFVYNTAVMRVDDRRIHNTYIDRTIVERNTIRNDRRVAFSGGRDGIHHDPRPEERFANRDKHQSETTFQRSHELAARGDRSMYVKNNGGRPSSGAVQRPFDNGSQRGPSRMQNQGGGGNQGRGNYTPPNPGSRDNRNFNNPRNNDTNRGGSFNTPRNNNPQPDNRNFNNPRGNSGNPRSQPEFRQAPQPRPAPQQQHPAPEFRQMPQQQRAPQMQSRPAPQPQSRPAPEQRGQGQGRGDHEGRPH